MKHDEDTTTIVRPLPVDHTSVLKLLCISAYILLQIFQ